MVGVISCYKFLVDIDIEMSIIRFLLHTLFIFQVAEIDADLLFVSLFERKDMKSSASLLTAFILTLGIK